MSVVRWVLVFILIIQISSCAMFESIVHPLDKKTSERVTQLRKDMLMRRAKASLQYEPIYLELETLLPKDHGAMDDIRQYKYERRKLANNLYDCGQQSMYEKNYPQAEECLELSNKLSSSSEKIILLEKAKLIHKQYEDKRRSEQIMLAYQSAYSSGNLAEAMVQLETLLAVTPDNMQALELHDQLATEIKVKMSKDLEEARSLYSRGKITEALNVCNKLMLVDPKNPELLALISRAEKINKNIEKLSKPKG
jgi:uncharacterized protein HemY